MARVCEDMFPLGSYKNQQAPGFYMDDLLKEQLDILIKNVIYDWDFTIIISGSGEVRVGKSVLAMQIGAYWTYQLNRINKFNLPFNVDDNFIWIWQDLIHKGHILGNKYHYCANIYDEAGETLETGKTASAEAKAVTDYLRECGQYNFLNILVMPEFFKLPIGVAITRSKFLIDVSYSADDNQYFERGIFKFYGPRQKKKLYLHGKKELNYMAAAYNFLGRFDNVYTVDKEQYKSKKNKAFGERDNRLTTRTRDMRNCAFYILFKDGKMNYKQISEKLNEYGRFSLGEDSVRMAIESYIDHFRKVL